MGKTVALALVAGLLLGVGAGTAAEPAAKAKNDAENTTVLLPEGATITILPGTKVSVHPIKTEQGFRIRLEIPGLTIEADRLSLKSKGQITELKIDAGNSFNVSSYPEGGNGAPKPAAIDQPGQ